MIKRRTEPFFTDGVGFAAELTIDHVGLITNITLIVQDERIAEVQDHPVYTSEQLNRMFDIVRQRYHDKIRR